MSNAARRLAPLLFGSGMCALIYQVAWFREFRMVFGASTAANAAVLAIFIGGLGIGGLMLGRRADRHANPILFYGQLEALVALSTASTPALLWLARQLYVVIGGTPRLGMLGGTIARLVLSALVLGLPTFLMGGTLPAAARGVEADDDHARRSTGLLYGVNTLGAVTGCTVSTFYMLEAVGTHVTLWLACAVNMLVAMTAMALANRKASPASALAAPAADSQSAPPGALAPSSPAFPSGASSPSWFTLTAATVVGFAFFLMEMVWYRMLGPILGGTVFTFGLILGVALFGIGLGGAFYGMVGSKRPATLLGFAYTCLAEAVLMILPYALGDRVATLTLMLRPLGLFGFSGLLSGWATVTLLVVAPAAFVSGVQFPMLIALLGRGRESVGSQIGLAYAFNTVGAIAGSLAGGFGLMPLLTAPGCWKLVAAMLGGLGLIALGLSASRDRRWLASAVPVGLAAACGLMIRAEGPTAVWRHSPIGVGRVDAESTVSARALRGWMNDERRAIVWEREGVESTVALNTSNGWAFVVNGKIDGSVRGDAPTQVMGGLVGAILHPEPKNAMVIGLGTGSTAGWLGSVPNISEVDVVEFEPAVLWVARRCMQVNQNVMENPKVKIAIGDAREVLVTTKKQYDIVFSEPSNPYRAGIASLFTREYYEAIANRLRADGILLQWVQAYNVDAQAVRTIYATLGAVFPEVETWELAANDLLLVASRTPLRYDAEHLRARIGAEPFKTALLSTWRAIDLEGFLAHYVAGPAMARAIAEAERGRLNTDDRTLVEFGFARTASDRTALSSADIRKTAHARGDDRPNRLVADLDLTHLEDEWMAFLTAEESQEDPPEYFSAEQKTRARAEALYGDGDWTRFVATWRMQSREPVGPTELAVVAEAFASMGDERARSYIDKLRAFQPTEADAIAARFMTRRKSAEQAAKSLESAFRRYRRDPWPLPSIMRHAFDTLDELVSDNPDLADRMYDVVSSPFVSYLHEDQRVRTTLRLARQHQLRVPCSETLKAVEPNVPWEEDLLRWRAACYSRIGDAAAAAAKQDLDQFMRQEPMRFGVGLVRPTTEYAATPR